MFLLPVTQRVQSSLENSKFARAQTLLPVEQSRNKEATTLKSLVKRAATELAHQQAAFHPRPPVSQRASENVNKK